MFTEYHLLNVTLCQFCTGNSCCFSGLQCSIFVRLVIIDALSFVDEICFVFCSSQEAARKVGESDER
jgi:hypothetical protein